MLTFPSAYNSALSSPFNENWIVRLYSTASAYIGVSFADITMDDSVDYYGSIKNAPSVREAINIEAGKVTSSNISLECADVQIGFYKLSKHLYTSNYINRDVKIYSVLNGGTAMANALQIYSGRLSAIQKTEDESVKLSIVSHRPWNGIEIPNELGVNSVTGEIGKYSPVVYGNYSSNGIGDTTRHHLYPAPFLKSSGNVQYFIVHDEIADPNGSGHFWDSSGKSMARMTLFYDESITTHGLGSEALALSSKLVRTHWLTAGYLSDDDFTDPENAVDGDLSTYAEATQSDTGSGVGQDDYFVTVPNVGGKVTTFRLYIKATGDYSGSTVAEDDQTFIEWGTVYDNNVTNTGNILSVQNMGSSGSLATSGSTDINGTGTAHGVYDLTSAVTSNDNQLPDKIRIRAEVDRVSSGTTVTSTYKIYDIWFIIICQEDQANEPTSAKQEVSNLKEIYVGSDGFDKSWSGGNLATKAEDAHRDLLYRYLGITDTPDNFSALASEKNCNVRFYTEPNKNRPILSYLEELSYEGGFTFRFSSVGTPTYNFIANNPSIDMTISQSQMSGLQVSHSPFNTVMTDWTAQYEKNPASSTYASKATYSDSSTRTALNFSAKENKKDIKLKHVIDNVDRTGTNRNDSFLDYYTSMVGSVKQFVSFSLIDPTKSNLEVGDIIAFSSMTTDKLDGSWHSTNDKFIVTSTSRSVGGKLEINAREI